MTRVNVQAADASKQAFGSAVQSDVLGALQVLTRRRTCCFIITFAAVSS